MTAQTAPFHAAPNMQFQEALAKNGESPAPPEKTPFWNLSPANKTGPRKWLTDERRQAVVACRQFGMVPLAIADYLGFSDTTVAKYLREAVRRGELESLPPWLTLHGS